MRVVSERLGHASAVMTLTVNQQSTPMWAAGSGRLRRAAGQLIRGRSSRAAFTGPLFDLNVRTAGLELAESRRASVSEGDTPHVHAPDRGLSQLARCGGEHPAPAPAISVLGLRRPEPPPASAQGIGRPSRRSGSQPPRVPELAGAVHVSVRTELWTARPPATPPWTPLSRRPAQSMAAVACQMTIRCESRPPTQVRSAHDSFPRADLQDDAPAKSISVVRADEGRPNASQRPSQRAPQTWSGTGVHHLVSEGGLELLSAAEHLDASWRLNLRFCLHRDAETAQIRIQILLNARAAVSRGVSRGDPSRTRLLTGRPARSRVCHPTQTTRCRLGGELSVLPLGVLVAISSVVVGRMATDYRLPAEVSFRPRRASSTATPRTANRGRRGISTRRPNRTTGSSPFSMARVTVRTSTPNTEAACATVTTAEPLALRSSRFTAIPPNQR